MSLVQERIYWEEHCTEYRFYDETEYQLLVSLLGGLSLVGRKILEIGCGSGVWTANLVRLGAQVYHIDLSISIVRSAKVAAAPYVTLGVVADMHRLPFADSSFEAVFGSMVLHHTSKQSELGQEVARVLAPGARAVFHENSARNPLLMLARTVLVGRLWVPKYSSPGEHPLRQSEIEEFARSFARKEIFVGRMVFMQLGVKYLLRTEQGPIFKLARLLDDFIYRYLPALRAMSYQQVLLFER